MKATISALAFLSSLVSLIVVGGAGFALLAVENSGERPTGVLLAFCGTVAFASVLVLVFARAERFREATWRAGAVAAAIIGAMPVAGLAAAAFRFAGIPLGSPVPLIDWPIFAAGLALGLGAVAIITLGYWRARTLDPQATVIHMQQIRDAQSQLHIALENASRPAPPGMADSDVRVRRV